MMKNQDKNNILTVGDVIVDWLLVHENMGKTNQTWNFLDRATIFHQWGGILLLKSLIEEATSSDTSFFNWEVISTFHPPVTVETEDPNFHHSFSMWGPYSEKLKTQNIDNNTKWRVENFIGTNINNLQREHRKPSDADIAMSADVLVIDDCNLSFRTDSNNWSSILENHKGWIVLKMATPIAQGLLWQELIKNHADRLIVITTACDLRMTNIQISHNLSWERTAQDVVWELTYNPMINSLMQAAFNIISFDCAGAILISSNRQNKYISELFFDPLFMEGAWERLHEGSMLGYTTCLAASVVNQVMKNQRQPDLHQAIQSGISAMRRLHNEGYLLGRDENGIEIFSFPFKKIAEQIKNQEKPFATVSIQDPISTVIESEAIKKEGNLNNYWTILEDCYTDKLEDISKQIVLIGSEKALNRVPVGRFGALITIDRREIEALNSIQRLIKNYCSSFQKKPLSIAVFGPPGSGKSFGVTQVAKSISNEIAILNFNLSQFQNLDDLVDAFHQVRDVGLSGKIPLVFWDEFDTAFNDQSLGWLRYFLSPMQDGTFQEEQIIHPIGRGIFVFAGGTSSRMDIFGHELSEQEQRALKLPDFVSRLKGYLNVLGPNPIKEINDPYYIIRRALILRSIFEQNTPSILHLQDGKKTVSIDPGLLSAFLLTKQYKHGVRSMESIISMSTLSAKTHFDLSSLPTEQQLNLHVDGLEFLSLMQRLELSDELLEKLAEAVHILFCEDQISKGFTYGNVTDNFQKTHSSLLPYEKLTENEKEQNRENVRDIPKKLASSGYIMHPARSNEPPFGFPGNDLERLAEQEHERWVNYKISSGWQYAPKTDKTAKLHQLLVPWNDLPDEEKEKDRLLVRQIPTILAKAGYAVKKIT